MWFKYAAVILGLAGFTLASPAHWHWYASDDTVIGSYAIDIDEVPYVVSIESTLGGKQCGGVVISDSWVVAPAHCVTHSPIHYRIRAGTSWKNIGGYTYPVDLIHSHNEYFSNQDTPINDIALLHSVIPIQFSNNRGYIGMFDANEVVPFGAVGFAITWEEERYKIDRSTSKSPQLYYIPALSVSVKHCRKKYGDRVHKANGGQLCISYGGVTEDICDGDTGAALVINGKLAGLYSWGCEDGHRLGVYTEIAHYRQWINKMTGI